MAEFNSKRVLLVGLKGESPSWHNTAPADTSKVIMTEVTCVTCQECSDLAGLVGTFNGFRSNTVSSALNGTWVGSGKILGGYIATNGCTVSGVVNGTTKFFDTGFYEHEATFTYRYLY